MTWPQEENGSPVAFTKDGKSVYVQSSLGYDTTRLLQVCLPPSFCHASTADQTIEDSKAKNRNICCLICDMVPVQLQHPRHM